MHCILAHSGAPKPFNFLCLYVKSLKLLVQYLP